MDEKSVWTRSVETAPAVDGSSADLSRGPLPTSGVPRLPQRVRVGFRTFMLVRENPTDWNKMAECDFVDWRLRFAERLADYELPNSLIHELLHAVCDNVGLDIPHLSQEAIANGLTAVLQDLGFLPSRLKLAHDA